MGLLQPLYEGFDANLITKAGASATQGSQTLLAETVFQLIKQFMKRAYKVNFAALEETNPELFKEFFPSGRTEYSAASRQTLGTAFTRFVHSLIANKAAVPDGTNLLQQAKSLAENTPKSARPRMLAKTK